MTAPAQKCQHASLWPEPLLAFILLTAPTSSSLWCHDSLIPFLSPAQLPSDANWNPRCDLCFWPIGYKSEVPTPPLSLFLFSLSVVSNSLRFHERSTPGFPVLHYLPEFAQTHVHWVRDATQPWWDGSVTPFSSCSQSFPHSGSFPVSRFFSSGGQSIGVSASASVLPMNI